MPDPDRFKLLFGPYGAPLFEYGQVVRDEVRGDVEICGMTGARIPWPVGKIGSAKSLVVYAGPAAAVWCESNVAVCSRWGITPQTVSKWRKALGVGPVTEGTRELMHENAGRPVVVEGLPRAQAKTGDPQRRAKIAAAGEEAASARR